MQQLLACNQTKYNEVCCTNVRQLTQFLFLSGCDLTQLLCSMGEWAEIFVWGESEEGGEEVTGKERGALRRWVESEEGVHTQKYFKTFLVLCQQQASVRLWTTSRKSSSFPLWLFPTRLCVTSCTLHFNFCWDWSVNKTCSWDTSPQMVGTALWYVV